MISHQSIGFYVGAKFLAGVSVLIAVLSTSTAVESSQPHYSPALAQSFPRNVYWGDTHVHSNLSMFAFAFSNRELGPDAAYRFAKGETISTAKGITAKISRPLDFMVVADDASNMGVLHGIANGDNDMLRSPLAQQFKQRLDAVDQLAELNPQKAIELSLEFRGDAIFSGQALDKTSQQRIWQSVTALADKHNTPGQFTAFIGYEWAGLSQIHNNHRVVIFKDDASKVNQVLPFSQYDGNDPEALWGYFSDYEKQTKGEVFAIPHSGNASLGTMFALETPQGKPLTTDYAKKRSRWEPLFEVTQIKGDSETHPHVSPQDSFADYATVSNRPADLAGGNGAQKNQGHQ